MILIYQNHNELNLDSFIPEAKKVGLKFVYINKELSRFGDNKLIPLECKEVITDVKTKHGCAIMVKHGQLSVCLVNVCIEENHTEIQHKDGNLIGPHYIKIYESGPFMDLLPYGEFVHYSIMDKSNTILSEGSMIRIVTIIKDQGIKDQGIKDQGCFLVKDTRCKTC